MSGSAIPRIFLIGLPLSHSPQSVGRYPYDGRVLIPLMLSDRIAANGNTWPDTCLRNERASMYPEMRSYATRVAPFAVGCISASGWLELSIALDEFFCSPARKTHGDAPVFFVAFDADNSANAVARVANFATKHGVCVGAAFGSGPAERVGGAGGFGRCHRGFRFAAHPSQKLVRRIGILWVGLVAPFLPDLRHRS